MKDDTEKVGGPLGGRPGRRGDGTGGCAPTASDPGSSGPGPGRREGRHRRALMEPAVLLVLLDEQKTHGYELIERIEGLIGGEVCVDPGSVYRLLREMEARGLLTSSWEMADRGPNRRSYSVTGAGEQALHTHVKELRRRAAALQALAGEAETRLATTGNHDEQSSTKEMA